mgnify:CR=1 FL=1
MSDNAQQGLGLNDPNQEAKQDGPVECLGKTFANDAERREHYLGLLAEKLKDPEFRKIEGFPIGEDEDILELSDPPYYTACPNPFMEDYLNWWRHQSESEARINESVSPYVQDVKATMRDPVLNLHSYHTKVPPKALASLILHYTKPGDVVLDAYAGSGMTAFGVDLCTVAPKEASKEEARRYGKRACILSDLSALASHIEGVHVRALPIDFSDIADSVISAAERDNKWLYESFKVGQEDKKDCNTRFAVWSEFYACEHCAHEIESWSSQVDRDNVCIHKVISCPGCSTEYKTDKLKRVTVTEFDQVLGKPRKVTKKQLCWMVLNSESGRYEREAIESDLKATDKAVNKLNGMNIPIQELPYMHMSHERNDLPSLGYDYVHSFFAPRTLFAISDLFERFKSDHISPTSRRWLKYLVTSVLDTHLVVRNRYLIDKHHASGTSCGPLSGTLYVPTLQCEVNVYDALRKKLKKIISAGERLSRERGLVSNQPAQSLSLPEGSIDYIFIDPPFGANINYSDLNFLSESWLGVSTNRPPEAVIDRVQNKDLNEYGNLMASGLEKCYRSLKAGGWMTLLFHNSKNAVWNSIQESVLKAGFVIADVRVLDKGGTTIFQDSQAAAVKKDLLITAYKPSVDLGSVGLGSSAESVDGTVWDFVEEHLAKLPVCVVNDDEIIVVRERERHLLFDRMVAFFVSNGLPVPISSPEFYSGLEERYAVRDDMFFLPGQVVLYDKKRARVGRVCQLALFIVDEESAIQWVRQKLSIKPDTFQGIHPSFISELGGWKKAEEQLELSKLLEQNFIKYEGEGPLPPQIHSYLSTNFKEMRNLPKDDPQLVKKAKDRWYVPNPEREEDLEKLRERDLLKQFEEYRAHSGRKLKTVRMEAVRCGFKKAWQERDYPTIISVAEKIPQNLLQEDQKLLMWYDQAQTRHSDESLF